MRKFKKIITIIICIAMLISNFSFTFGEEKDYENHWAKDIIQKWLDEGKVSGYPDGKFKPDNNITRAEFVKMVNGLIDYNNKSLITYKDVLKGEWYYDFICIAKDIGYIEGYSADKFGPNDFITREQAAVILSRIQYLQDNKAGTDVFSDNASFSSWASGGAGAAVKAGFVVGYDDGSFRPSNNLTRAEALTMLDNVLKNAKNTIVYKSGTVLKDTAVEGDLIIAKTVGDGDVHINNVEVKGSIKVFGGGKNSVYFNNVKVARIEINKEQVRVVLDDGTVVEEVSVGSEAILENKNGEVAKITVSAAGEVSLSGSFKEVAVIGNTDIVLNEAKIDSLVVETKINITGTGTISSLQANADGIQYESKIKVEEVVIGKNVTEKPAVISDSGGSEGGGGGLPPTETSVIRITLKSPDSEAKVFNTASYTGSTVFSDFIVAQTKDIINKSDNNAFVTDYINKLNARINSLEVDGIGITSPEGWEKVLLYLDDISFKNDVDNLLGDGEINGVEELSSLIDLYGSLTQEDVNAIDSLLEVFVENNTITYKNKALSYSLTNKNNTYDSIEDIADFIFTELLLSEKTVEQFFSQYGKVTIKTVYEDSEAIISIEKAALIN